MGPGAVPGGDRIGDLGFYFARADPQGRHPSLLYIFHDRPAQHVQELRVVHDAEISFCPLLFFHALSRSFFLSTVATWNRLRSLAISTGPKDHFQHLEERNIPEGIFLFLPYSFPDAGQLESGRSSRVFLRQRVVRRESVLNEFHFHI